MKITTKILHKRTNGNVGKTLYLDLSGLGIGAIENFEVCPNLQNVNLSDNCLEEFEHFESCENLWRVNLSNNHICNLKSLSKFYAIGSLDLSNNNICWKQIAPIRDTHILDIRLHGNPDLENDPHYRIHVVDCLPRIWFLDGRIVTATERLQVQHFFQDSALSTKPVRRKLAENKFYRVSYRCEVIHGVRANQLAAIFPGNEIQNRDTDKRRLEFFAENLQKDFKIEQQCKNNYDVILDEQCLKTLVHNRHKDKERSNMLLLLLIASLEFELPDLLIEQTLQVAKLDILFGVETLQLFHLSAHNMVDVISLFVSACKLDRDLERPPQVSNFTSGGLYDRLYLCLYHSVAHLKIKKLNQKSKGKTNKRNNQRPQTAPVGRRSLQSPKPSKQSEWKAHLSLLSSEVVLLLSVVPSFYNFILNYHPGVCKLLLGATGDSQLPLRLASISNNLSIHGGNTDALYSEIYRSVVRKIEKASDNISTNQGEVDPYFNPGVITPNTKEARFILNTAGSYPRRPKSAVLTSGEHLTTGKIRKMTHCMTPKPTETPLTLGSNIALGAQNLAKVIALPEKNVALVQMASIPAPNGAVVVQSNNMEEHYCYVDTTLLEFDLETSFWKPKGATGDLVTLQRVESLLDTPETTLLSPTSTPRKPTIKGIDVSLAPKSSLISAPFYPQIAPAEFDPLPQPQRPLSAMFCEKMEISLSQIGIENEVYPQYGNSFIEGSFKEIKQEHIQTEKYYKSNFYRNKNKKKLPYKPNNNADCYNNNAPFVQIAPINTPVFLTQPHVQIPTNVEQIFDSTTDGAKELGDDDIAATREARELNKEDVDSDLPQTDEEGSVAEEENFSHIQNEREEDDVEKEEANVREGKEEEHKKEERGSPLVQQNNLLSMKTVEKVVANDNDLSNSDNEEKVKYLDEEKKPVEKLLKSENEIKRRVKSARIPATPLVKESDRPQSAIVARHVLFRDESDDDSRHGSVSSFQLRRTEAWRSSASSGSGFGVQAGKFRDVGFVRERIGANQVIPPQRPTSPTQVTIAPSITVATNEDKPLKLISIQTSNRSTLRKKGISRTTSSWLAEGRNLHQENNEKSRLVTSPRLPGYLEGTNMLPSNNKARAQSAKSIKTLLRSDVAKHSLPSRMIKPFLCLPSYRRSNSPSNPVSLGGGLARQRPQFSPFSEVKKLANSPAAAYNQRKKFPSLKYLT